MTRFGDAPALLKQATDQFGVSLYVQIRHGGEGSAMPMTGIFLPHGFQPDLRCDIILYLHGFKRQSPSLSIDVYWDQALSLFWPLREGVKQACRNVVLVAPTLGPLSQAGWLIERGGLDRYLELVTRALQGTFYHAKTGSMQLRHLILASHSGGGLPMRRLALSDQTSAAQIRECWGFDCTYNDGDDTEWARWADTHPAAKLYVYYIARTPTEALSHKLERLARQNVFVLKAGTSMHNLVPITHWRERIAGATFLTPLVSPSH